MAVSFGGAAHAVGLAWVCSYGLQVVLLSGSAWGAVRKLGNHETPIPSIGQMLSLGGWWQLSSWADFATFQLPRLAGGFALSANALVALDVAIRAAQLAVAPLFAVYPLLLPAAARAWTRGGAHEMKVFLERWFLRGAIALWLLATSFVPLERAALAAWTGRSAESFDIWLNASVLIGVVAHASTGLFSSARLAVGNVRPVVQYKTWQLILGLVFIPPAVVVGPVATGIALGIALAAPALLYNRREVDAFQLRLPSRHSPVWRRVTVVTVLLVSILSFAVSLLAGKLPSWLVILALLPFWASASALAWLWCSRSLVPVER